MKKALILMADGFEEIEAVTLIDVLRRAGIETRTAGVTGTTVKGAHGVEIKTDESIEMTNKTRFDLVVLPGGMPGATHLRDDARVQSLVRTQATEGRFVAAICAAPIALGRAGILEGKKATCYPGFEKDLNGATWVEQNVVVDGNVVTSRGPGTAMAFALVLVELMLDKSVATKVKSQMLA